MLKSTYKPLILPKLGWDKESMTRSFGRLVVQPLESGFGTTFGNALRRVMLGAIEASAVTSVIIKGINNEFATLPGVSEDVMQILLNIKQIVIKNKDNKPASMKLSVVADANNRIVTVADIESDEILELINKDHVLATLSAGTTLDIEFNVESGRGYQLAKWPIGTSLEKDGKIYLDAMFSPVRNVVMNVEKTRVGKEIDYDKLILEITTNEADSPVDVVNYAVSILRTQLENFLMDDEINFNEIATPIESETTSQEDLAEDEELQKLPLDIILKSIDELELSARAHNCLVNASINRVIDLINVSEDDSLRIKNFGRKSLDEVRDVLKKLGLGFGMTLKEEAVERALKKNSAK